MKKIILCVFPRAGLANKLLVLAKCYARAYVSDAIVIETIFAQIPLLSTFKNFRQPRIYLLCPIQANYFLPSIWTLLYMLGLCDLVFRPFRAFVQLETINYFDSYPLYSNPYGDLTSEITGEFTKATLLNRIGLKINTTENSLHKGIAFSAVHIRLGDFGDRTDGLLRPNSRTPLDYFSEVIKDLFAFYKKRAMPWKIRVFTDEVGIVRRSIPDLECIEVCSGHPLDDFVSLIECDVLVPTPWSTFSGLAAHLSTRKVVIIPEELHFQFIENKELVVTSPSCIKYTLKEYYSRS